MRAVVRTSLMLAAAFTCSSTGLLACSLLVDNALDDNDYDAVSDSGRGNPDFPNTTMNRKDGGARSNDGGAGHGGSGGSSVDSGTGGSGGSGGSSVDSGTGGSGGTGGAGTGGDGGTGGDSGPPVDGGIDSGTPEALTIVGSSPLDGANTTYFVSKVEVTFSAPINPVTSSQLNVTGGDASSRIAGALSTDGATVTFTFATPLRAADDYRVTVDGVTSTAGATIAAHTIDFAIVPGFPADTQYIDRNDTPGGSLPEVAVDGQGNALAVWLQKGPGGSQTYAAPWYAFYTYGVGWDTPHALDASQGVAFEPKVAMAPDGRAIVAWTHWSTSTVEPEHIMARQYLPANGGWQTAVVLDNDPDTSDGSHHVAVAINASGRAVVAWLRGDDNAAMGQGKGYVSLGDNAGFGLPVSLLQSGSAINGSGPLDAAIDSAGLAAVAGHFFTDHALWKQHAASADWDRLTREYEYTSVQDIAAAVDSSDVFYAGCHAPEAGGTSVTRGVLPTPQERIDSNADSNRDPQLGIAADIDAVAAWVAQKTAQDTVSVRALSYTPADGDWALTASDIFPDRGALVPSGPDVAAYLGTSALIAWQAGGEIYTVERDDSTGYGAATSRDHVSEAVQPGVRIAASKQLGTGVLVWQEDDGVNPPRIAAQSFRGAQ